MTHETACGHKQSSQRPVMTTPEDSEGSVIFGVVMTGLCLTFALTAGYIEQNERAADPAAYYEPDDVAAAVSEYNARHATPVSQDDYMTVSGIQKIVDADTDWQDLVTRYATYEGYLAETGQ